MMELSAFITFLAFVLQTSLPLQSSEGMSVRWWNFVYYHRSLYAFTSWIYGVTVFLFSPIQLSLFLNFDLHHFNPVKSKYLFSFSEQFGHGQLFFFHFYASVWTWNILYMYCTFSRFHNFVRENVD